ncbi:endonuclease/exonuclease/phosphatase family protein [Nocardioides jiangxiensis]|uniref:Endonuclease/exonuclease/phosphatase family protein n=1 Tax=Nocardioides jiangxiensis TaxID=3064524 RepID=A0ABT9B116_9ACTN|nr:endonuclease/exonuclease/phosphatase family protein [Nocardioides sp. WY-20]MDO7868095.1 endonuclease/exonuclease/phosphatase family protein [Nocardioides sp. WY-20]
MRKPPELVVTLAPLLVIVLVLAGVGVAFGLTGNDGHRANASASAPTTPPATTPPPTPVITPSRAPDIPISKDLLRNVRKQLDTLPAFRFQIATLNVLGNSHTVAGGDRAEYADSATRMGWALQALQEASADVVGFQEMQAPQYAAFRARTGSRWDSWPGLAVNQDAVDNTLAWDTSTFRAVERETIAIPYFFGRTRQMPYVLLENVQTRQRIWVANFHNPAHKYGATQARWRREATAREIALVNKLAAQTGYPVFVTGDMNERQEYCSPVTASTDLRWAGGSCSSGRMPVDFILGSSRVGFADYTIRDRGVLGRVTDHPLVYATATVPESRAPSLTK